MQIAIYAFDGISMFHLAVPQMAFGEVTRFGLADWRTSLFAEAPGSVTTLEGQQIGPVAGFDAARDADLIVIPSWSEDFRVASPDIQTLLREEHARGAVIVGLCLGSFPIVDSGLLDGRSAVTHWNAINQLVNRRPNVEVDGSVLYVDHGDIITSAGTASGIDACLHIIRTRLGVAAANTVARSLVVAPHREGGQAQYVERPLPEQPNDDPIATVLEWALNHLDEPLRVDDLAAMANMSRRSFIRSFRDNTGTTPAAWVMSRRLDESRSLLETTDLSMDRVAQLSGFASTITFRQNFVRAFATTPTNYRKRFGDVPVTRIG